MKGRVRCVRIDLNGRGVVRAMEGELEGASPDLAQAVGDLVALMMGKRDDLTESGESSPTPGKRLSTGRK